MAVDGGFRGTMQEEGQMVANFKKLVIRMMLTGSTCPRACEVRRYSSLLQIP